MEGSDTARYKISSQVLPDVREEVGGGRMNFVFNQSGDGNTQIGSIGKTCGPEWVRTADRLPEGDEHDEVLSLYKGTDYLLYDIVQVGWLRLHPEMYVYWTRMPQKPEVEG